MIYILFLILVVLYYSLANRVSKLENLSKTSVLPPPVVSSTPVPAPVVAPAPVPSDSNLEFKFGSRAFTAVGVIAVVIGVGFFLRYAFDHNLITEAMRVVLGIIGGFLLLSIGWFLRSKYAAYSHALSGGGLALLYLSLYASFNYYSLVAQPTAFAGMILVTALGVALGLWYNSQPLFGFAMAGGFLTPILLSTRENHPHALFIYLVLLNAGIFAATIKKSWTHLILGNFAGTVLLFGMWYGEFYTESQYTTLLLYSSIFFLLFLAMTLAQWFQRKSLDSIGIMIALATPLFYATLNLFELDSVNPQYKILFVIILAVLYALLGIASHSIFYGISFALFFTAVPIQFDLHWVTIMWAALALVGGITGLYLKNGFIRTLSYLTLAAVAGKILIDGNPYRFGLTLVFALCSGILLWLIHRADDRVSQTERDLMSALLFGGINFMLLWAISMEIVDYWKDSENLKRAMLSVAWTVYAIFLLMGGIISKSSLARFFAIMLFGIVVFKVFLYDTVNLDDLYRFISFISLGIILLVSGFLYYRYKDRIRHFIKGEQ